MFLCFFMKLFTNQEKNQSVHMIEAFVLSVSYQENEMHQTNSTPLS